MLKEFREFVSRGNVIDLAIGIVIGAAFSTLVKSFVDDILMPPVGLITGGVDFSELYINLGGVAYPTLAAATEAGAPLIRYGLFINSILSFLIVAVAVFFVIKAYNRLRAPQAAPAAPTGVQCPFCLETVHPDARRCSHCTSELSAPIAAVGGA